MKKKNEIYFIIGIIVIALALIPRFLLQYRGKHFGISLST